MRLPRVVLVVSLALLVGVGGCGGHDSPTSPPPSPANVVATGSLTTLGCFILPASPTLATCATFNGTAVNNGAGCAAGVRGVVTTYSTPGNTQLGSASWSYAGPIVRAGETVAFSGGPVTVGVPLSGGWVYLNAVTFESVRC